MNKINLVEKKKDLLKVAKEFKDLPRYERNFMISGLKGGMSKRSDSVLDGAVRRAWEEDPFTMSEEVMKMIALEVVRERLLDLHQVVVGFLDSSNI
ncbi:hypothetical protein GYH30_022472 [Glycine max]|uniref:Uncharacterized protein n=1 Tax=Glycine max TaxID=3847 RepID=K7L907_SOYBN|nr:hypothetical protein GYH30_022472 [Glycine max]